MKVVIATVLVYSLILTIVTIIKDNSGYYMIGALDIIFSGPVCWILMLFLVILRSLYKAAPINIRNRATGRPKKEKVYSEAHIRRVVARIIKRDKKRREKLQDDGYYISLDRKMDFDENYIAGWGYFLKSGEFNERLNKQFSAIMYGEQAHIAKDIFLSTFHSATPEELVKNNAVFSLCDAERIMKSNDIVFVSY